MSSNFGTVRPLHLIVFAVAGGGGPCATPCAHPFGALANITITSSPKTSTSLRINSIHLQAATVERPGNVAFFINHSANQQPPSALSSFWTDPALHIRKVLVLFRRTLFDYAMKRATSPAAHTHPYPLFDSRRQSLDIPKPGACTCTRFRVRYRTSSHLSGE